MLSVIYPSFCLHCQKEGPSLFCSLCQESLVLLKSPVEYLDSPFEGIVATFDYEGPASALVTKLKYGNSTYLAKTAASFMAIQFLKQNWPMPDFLVPIPIPWLRKMQRGYNQSLLLAQELSKLLNVPVIDILKKKGSSLPQAALNKEERSKMNHDSIKLKRSASIEDKTILLIDDVLTTGSTLKTAANALLEGSPKKLYALTLCHAF